MQSSPNPETQLMSSILEPLLEDFKYWFSRSQSFLESEKITFLSISEQEQLLQKIKHSLEEVNTATMMFKITEGQAGIDTKVLFGWHQLVGECWTLVSKWRQHKNLSSDTKDI